MSVILIDSDNIKHGIDIDLLKRSKLISNLISDLSEKDAEIPLSNVSNATLVKILSYLEHYKDDLTLPDSDDKEGRSRTFKNSTTRDVPEFMFELCSDLEKKDLFDLLRASNYLDIYHLMDMICRIISLKVSKMTPDEIRDYFEIKVESSDPVNPDPERVSDPVNPDSDPDPESVSESESDPESVSESDPDPESVSDSDPE